MIKWERILGMKLTQTKSAHDQKFSKGRQSLADTFSVSVAIRALINQL